MIKKAAPKDSLRIIHAVFRITVPDTGVSCKVRF